MPCGGGETAGGEVGVDLQSVAGASAGLSGADLANVVNEAALLAVRSNADAVGQDHFNAALAKQLRYRPN